MLVWGSGFGVQGLGSRRMLRTREIWGIWSWCTCILRSWNAGPLLKPLQASGFYVHVLSCLGIWSLCKLRDYGMSLNALYCLGGLRHYCMGPGRSSENCSILLFDSEAALLLALRTSIALRLLPEKHLFRQVASGPGARLRSHMATGRNNLEELHMILI